MIHSKDLESEPESIRRIDMSEQAKDFLAWYGKANKMIRSAARNGKDFEEVKRTLLHPASKSIEKKGYELVVSAFEQIFKDEFPNAPFLYSGAEQDEYDQYENAIGITQKVCFGPLLRKPTSELFETLGEEFGHYLRSTYTDSVDMEFAEDEDWNVQEFFGLLGERILQASLDDYTQEHLFPKVNQMQEDGSVVERLREIRKEKRTLEQILQDSRKVLERTKIIEFQEKISLLTEEREEILTHFQGYKYAMKIDLRRITDWKHLYSLSDKEVRERFFRDNMNYDSI